MNSPVAWTLVFHIIGFVFWMAGLLVTTQVLSQHAEEPAPEARRALGFLERRLLNGIALPGAIITIGAGILVVVEQPGYLRETWLHMKLALVLILIGLNVAVYLRAKAFRSGETELTRRECKIWHGLISLVFLGIVVIVMIKPFS
jgi:protoporphyrinogen IX oxidase